MLRWGIVNEKPSGFVYVVADVVDAIAVVALTAGAESELQIGEVHVFTNADSVSLYKNGNFVITSSGVYDADTYFNSIYAYNNIIIFLIINCNNYFTKYDKNYRINMLILIRHIYFMQRFNS